MSFYSLTGPVGSADVASRKSEGGILAQIGAAIRIGAALDAHAKPDPRDIATLGLEAPFHNLDIARA